MNALGKTRQSSGYNMTLGRLLEGLDVPHGRAVGGDDHVGVGHLRRQVLG